MRATVLLAEDDAITRWDLREMLIGRGYRVVEAYDGEDAVRKARSHWPDLLLLDIKMPRLDGLGVAERLAGSGIPIVFLTAYSPSALTERAREQGVHGFLIKPAPEPEVIAALELALVHAQSLRRLEGELAHTHRELAARKEVERAKDLLAARLGISVEEAYGRMRQESMRRSRPLREIAAEILRKGVDR